MNKSEFKRKVFPKIDQSPEVMYAITEGRFVDNYSVWVQFSEGVDVPIVKTGVLAHSQHRSLVDLRVNTYRGWLKELSSDNQPAKQSDFSRFKAFFNSMDMAFVWSEHTSDSGTVWNNIAFVHEYKETTKVDDKRIEHCDSYEFENGELVGHPADHIGRM